MQTLHALPHPRGRQACLTALSGTATISLGQSTTFEILTGGEIDTVNDPSKITAVNI
jgi:hypothetical protein